MSTTTFLSAEDIIALTGKRAKSTQIRQLRAMGVPFFVNATGHPVVARATVEGGKAVPAPKPAWVPRVLSKS